MDIYTVQNIISYFDFDTKLIMRRVCKLMYDNITITEIPYFPMSSFTTHGYRFIGCAYGSWRILANTKYDQFEDYIGDLRADLESACIGGDIHMFNIVRKISHSFGHQIENDHMAIVDGFYTACNHGNYDLVKYIILNRHEFPSVTDYRYWLSSGLSGACSSGDIDTINLLLSYGAKSYNKSLISACCEGHFDVVKKLIQLGANNIQKGFYYACMYGRIDIIVYFLDNYKVSLKKGLSKACLGNLETVNLLLSHGAQFNKHSFDDACHNGFFRKINVHIVERIIRSGVISWRNAMHKACRYGYLDLAKYIAFKNKFQRYYEYGHATNSHHWKNIKIKCH